MGDPCNAYTYDDLDRLTDVVYHDSDSEVFVMDALGNRAGNQILRDEGSVNFTVDSATNRYTAIGGSSISHDDAGNLTVDKDGYQYMYDYENRVVKIEDVNDVEVATYAYDALGRRIKMIDSIASTTTLYYYNPDWQVLAEYDGSNSLQRYFVYGNYIDEPLVMYRQSDGEDYYYGQDHLYSTVVLMDDAGNVVERYEYDAYGTVLGYTDDGNDDTWFTGDDTTASASAKGNPYTFTGRRLDVLDSGDLLRMHHRYRDYDVYAGRFVQRDALQVLILTLQQRLLGVGGILQERIPAYEYGRGNPVRVVDGYGLWGETIHTDATRERAEDEEVGLCFSGEVAGWCQSLDSGLSNATTAFALAELAQIAGPIIGGIIAPGGGSDLGAAAGIAAAEAYLRYIAYWHFPGADVGMPVYPGSGFASREIEISVKLCHLKKFSKGLHQLQDSWSHQTNGRLPPFGHHKLGHSRDRNGWNTEKWDDPEANPYMGWVPGWFPDWIRIPILKRLRIVATALSDDMDKEESRFAGDAESTKEATKRAMQRFLETCPCIKMGPHAGEKSKCTY